MPNYTPSLKALRAFLVVAEQQSITSAAQELNQTQGAVSRQLASLEALAGTPLLKRLPRGVRLTSAGEELLPQVQAGLEKITGAFAALAQGNERSTRSKKLKAPSCITSWLLPRVDQFLSEHEDIGIALTTAISHDINFTVEDFDFAITFEPWRNTTENDSRPLFAEKLVPMCAPSRLADLDSGATPDQLALQPWLHSDNAQSDWIAWLKRKGLSEPATKHHQYFETLDLAMSAAIQGFGFVMGDLTIAQQALNSGQLVALEDDGFETGFGYYLHRHTRDENQIFTQLADFLAV